MKKTKWYALLFLATLLFFVGLYTQQYAVYILVIGIAFYIYQNGYETLFSEYDKQKKDKLEERLKVLNAVDKARKDGTLKNNK